MINIKNDEELINYCGEHFPNGEVGDRCDSESCELRKYFLCADRIIAPSIVREQNRQKTLHNISIHNRKEKLEKLLS